MYDDKGFFIENELHCHRLAIRVPRAARPIKTPSRTFPKNFAGAGWRQLNDSHED
jgi:hypothetical protein